MNYLREATMNLRKELIISPGKKSRLHHLDPAATPGMRDKREAVEFVEKNTKRLSELQYLLYAEGKRAVLVVIQAMDAGGKDGTIRHVMTGLNPQGCTVTSFKVPNAEEMRHDFLWRIHRSVPASGEIGIFNRSHYEDVLVVRVHKLVPKDVWSARYRQINAFEEMLAHSRVTILKFFLHMSREEQKMRFKERLSDPTKQWKISEADFAERRHWDDYMAAYEDALAECSTPWAPWYVIPSDHKWFRNLAVSQVIVETMEEMNLKFPKPSVNPARIRIT